MSPSRAKNVQTQGQESPVDLVKLEFLQILCFVQKNVKNEGTGLNSKSLGSFLVESTMYNIMK